MDSVSVIVSFYERLGHLKCCLDALSLNADSFDEVVIADDGSSEQTVAALYAMLPSYRFRVVHAWHPKDGFRVAAARNNAIRKAQGEYLVFLDCDFVVLPGAIRAHCQKAQRGRFVTGFWKWLTEEATKSLMEGGITGESLEATYRQFPDRPISRKHWEFVRYNFLARLRLVSPRKVRCSSHFSIHRADIEAINGYDENFIGWGGEDEDISLRMVKAGFRGCSAIREARAMHLWHPRELGGKHWSKGPNIPYLYRKNIPVFCENGLTKKPAQLHRQ